MITVTKKYLKILKNWLASIKKTFQEKIDYLNKFERKSAEFYCNLKIYKAKEIQSAIKKANEDYTEIYQAKDFKSRPILASPESATQSLSHLLQDRRNGFQSGRAMEH